MTRNTLALLLPFLLLTACGKNDKTQWAARINGRPIPLEEFERRYNLYLETLRRQPGYRPLSPEETQLLRRELLKTMIGEALILRELKREGFDKRPEVRQLFNQFLVQKYLEERIVGTLTVSPQEVEDFYRRNRRFFQGIDPELAQQRIQYQLTLKKFETATSELVDRLYAKAKVEQNEEILRGHASAPTNR